jgi:GNAT superfamily N-acetyltransferase
VAAAGRSPSSGADAAARGVVRFSAYDPPVAITYEWRGAFANDEVNALHAEAFATEAFSAEEWDWRAQVLGHSLGWVVARDGAALVGFVNVPWDGLVHAWIQDTMVAAAARRRGVGTALVARARDEARAAGCEWLHVDFADHLRDFYLSACGFIPTNAGLIAL